MLPSRNLYMRRHFQFLRRYGMFLRVPPLRKNVSKVGLLGINYSPVNKKLARAVHSNATTQTKEKNTTKEQARETVLFAIFT